MRARPASFMGYLGETAAGVAATSDSGSDSSGAHMDMEADATNITAAAQPMSPVLQQQQQQQRIGQGDQNVADTTTAAHARASTAAAKAVAAVWGEDGSADNGELQQPSVAASEALIAAGALSRHPIFRAFARFQTHGFSSSCLSLLCVRSYAKPHCVCADERGEPQTGAPWLAAFSDVAEQNLAVHVHSLR